MLETAEESVLTRSALLSVLEIVFIKNWKTKESFLFADSDLGDKPRNENTDWPLSVIYAFYDYGI